LCEVKSVGSKAFEGEKEAPISIKRFSGSEVEGRSPMIGAKSDNGKNPSGVWTREKEHFGGKKMIWEADTVTVGTKQER